MTYAHALQYLDGPGVTTVSASTARLSAYAAALGDTDRRLFTLCFSSDRTGLATAAYCRAALVCAGITVGEIADATTGPLARVLCVNGVPVSPDSLKELCHLARKEEQRLGRDRTLLAAEGHDTEQSPKATLPPLSAADRCAAVLPRLFSLLGCRVILLIGDPTSPRLRGLSERCPDMTVTVLSGGDHRSLPLIRTATAQVVAPTCGRTMYRQISDACARAGSRLTLTVTSALTRHSFCTGAQSFSYRSIERCPLRCGTTSALQAACLTIETLGALSRLGCNVSSEHIRQGLAATSLSYHFSPLSIQPLIIADCVTDADDLTALLQTLQELSPTLPKPLRAIPDPAMPDTERARLLEICGGEMSEESSLISEDEGTLLLVGSRNFLDGIVAQRT